MNILKRIRLDGSISNKLISALAISLISVIVTLTAASTFDHVQFASAANQQENINTRPTSLSTISTIIGTGAAATGAIVTVPSYLRTRKQPKFLAAYLLKIHNKYEELCMNTNHSDKTKNEYLNFLNTLHSHIIYSLQNGNINENQYRLLEDRIAEYVNRINYLK